MRDAKRIILALSFVLALLLPLNAYAFFGLFEDSNITLVKDGTFTFDKSVTIGNVLDNHPYLYNQEWTSLEDNQKRTFVQFKANIPVKLVGTFFPDKATDVVQSALGEKSVYADYIDTTKLVLQFIIYEGGKTFDIAYCGLEGKGQELDTSGYNANMVLKEIYANHMPYKGIILAMMLRSYVMNSIADLTNNFTQIFYQASLNSDLALTLEKDSSRLRNCKRWHDLGVDTSRSYFKVSNVTYDTIELETVFLLTASSANSKSKNVYEYTIQKSTFPIKNSKCNKVGDFSLVIKEGNFDFIINKNAKKEYVTARVQYSELIDKEYYDADRNIFICSELAKPNNDISWETYYGVYMGKDKESGYYMFDEGAGSEVALRSDNSSLLKNSDIGKAFTVTVAKDSIFSVEKDSNYKPEPFAIEGITLEVTNDSWVLQDANGTKYSFNIDHPQAYELRRQRLGTHYQYVEGKGLAIIGYQGRIVTGTWTVHGFTNWYYDEKTGEAKFINFATRIDGIHKTPQNKGLYHEFVAMPD